MAWIDDVRACVEQLPRTFRLHDLDPFLPRLHRLHPDNLHIREKVRQQLQVLRDAGEVEFLEPGQYRRQYGQDGGLPLKPGTTTTRGELAEILDMKGPEALQRGMFKRNSGPFANDLLLFHHSATNPYGDSVEENGRILYVGQGKQGDQKLDGFNLDLARHLENGTRVHFFVKEQASGANLRYEGQILLDRVERVYRDEENRSVLEFHLIPDRDGQTRKEFGAAYQDIMEEPLAPHAVERPERVHVVRRALRDSAFAAHIREMYRDRCAVCGDTLAHPEEKWIDIQAAHVRAVAAGGPDARNNGIALCARHHWAFDHGIFSLTDDHKVKVPDSFEDPHGELGMNADIAVPDDPELEPHPDYLAWHRANWRFT